MAPAYLIQQRLQGVSRLTKEIGPAEPRHWALRLKMRLQSEETVVPRIPKAGQKIKKTGVSLTRRNHRSLCRRVLHMHVPDPGQQYVERLRKWRLAALNKVCRVKRGSQT